MPHGIGELILLERLSNFVVASKDSAGLNELHGLNNLRGELTIKILRSLVDVYEFCAANLKEKQRLQYLRLEWFSYYCERNDGDDVKNEEMALEELRPHQNLKGLSLVAYGGVKSPSWLPSLRNFVEIGFFNCRNIQLLFPFDQFPFLKKLMIDGLVDLEYIGTLNGRSSFPSLKDLTVKNCTKLKRWWGAMAKLPMFHCLSDLVIESCPNLISMPTFPSIRKLRLQKANIKSLEQTLKMRASVPKSHSASFVSSCAPTLSLLKHLEIWEIGGLEFLQEELLQSLISLEVLDIRSSPLSIGGNDSGGGQWQALQSLRSLHLENISEFVSLPQDLQHLTTLQQLHIISCHNLMSLSIGENDSGGGK